MPTKGERGKATDFSIAAIMAPRGPSFGHYHLQGIGNAAATANTSLECSAGKGFVAESTLDNRKSLFYEHRNRRRSSSKCSLFLLLLKIGAQILRRSQFLAVSIIFIMYRVFITFDKHEIIKLNTCALLLAEFKACFFNEKIKKLKKQIERIFEKRKQESHSDLARLGLFIDNKYLDNVNPTTHLLLT